MTIVTLFRDNLPRGLCFPIGLESFSECVPELEALNASIVFVWQSTWASQIFDAKEGNAGRLAVLQVRPTLPLMRINAPKVRAMADDSGVVVAEFAVAALHRSKVLEAFRSHGAGLVSATVQTNPQAEFSVFFDIEKCAFVLGKPSLRIW